MRSYKATITREGEWWLAKVDGLDGGSHTHARTLANLDEGVRDLIVLAEDLPDEAATDLHIDYRYDIDDEAVRFAATVAHARAEVNRSYERIRAETERLVAELRRNGYSVRDTASMLGITPGRVTQLEREREHVA